MGAQLIILEGMMKSGKSTLTSRLSVFGRDVEVIQLDQFLRKPVRPQTSYLNAIDIEAATCQITEAVATAPLVVAEGPIAWPVTEAARQDVSSHAVRRVYLKRMSPRNPDHWEEFEFAEEQNKCRDEFFLSIDRYHVTERPWLAADLILERTGSD